LTTVGLSLLFMVVYGGTNYLTSLRGSVGTWYYSWERYIPFVPAMIIPYMSIDLFFVAAPFLCSDRKELRLLRNRIVMAVLVAGTCFLLFPLTLAVERPPAAGWMGELFNTFRQYDLPYNLCPSLHIALRVILADHYARHTKGALRWLTQFWFFLIGLSTLLTYQHHVVDVVGGFLLGIACFYLIRATPFRLPVEPNVVVGRRYAVGAALFTAIAIAVGSWALWLLWPALACGLVAAGYFGMGPGIFGKAEGQLPWSAQLVLALVLWGQRLSLRYYARQCEPWNQVTENVWIGRQLSDSEAERAVQEGVTAVVDLTSAFSETASFRNVNYRSLPVLDLTAPTAAQVDEAVRFIQEESQRGVVYVHCKIGYSRSAAVMGCYLLASGNARTAEDAMARLRESRPQIVIRPEAAETIEQYAASRSVLSEPNKKEPVSSV